MKVGAIQAVTVPINRIKLRKRKPEKKAFTYMLQKINGRHEEKANLKNDLIESYMKMPSI